MMFESARVKLTLWYTIFILLISISFSMFVYRQLMSEVRRSLRLHSYRLFPSQEFSFPIPFSPDKSQQFKLSDLYDQENEIYDEIRKRILLQLITINAAIAAFSGLGGYILAGKTLQPIEIMVDDQKRFTADASHELRTPLTVMKTEIEVALRDKSLTLINAKKLLESALEEVNKMQKLSNYLLTLSRYQDEKTLLPKEKLDIKELTTQAVERIQYLADNKKITILNKSKGYTIQGDPLSLTEMITIFLDNAIKYSHAHDKIIVNAVSEKHTIKISIEDFGLGIKSSEIPYIFNRFYRADSSRSKTKIDGYGLGLSIAKNIIELHHGTVDVHSEVNKGTKFTVSLPR